MYKSTAESFEEFEKSIIWQDILGELKMWLDDIHEAMEDPKNLRSEREHATLRGNADTIHKVEELPEMIRKNIIDDMEGNQNG